MNKYVICQMMISAMEENEVEKGKIKVRRLGGICSFSFFNRVGLGNAHKTFEQRPEVSEKATVLMGKEELFPWGNGE